MKIFFSQIKEFSPFKEMGKNKAQTVLVTVALILTTYTGACIVFLFRNTKTPEKQEPIGLKNLRPGLEKVGKENDPFLREYLLQEEAAKSKKTVNDYRLLFENYRKNKTKFLPKYPNHQWSILAWGFWFFKDVAPSKRGELLKNSFLTIIEKGALITGAIAVGKWLWESPQRRKQEQYQAWQIIHLADGKDVSGARKQALEDLTRQKASLAGLVAEKAVLSGIYLKKANLFRAKLSGADLSRADLSFAKLSGADLSGADLSFAKLSGAFLSSANLSSAKLSGADLSGAFLESAHLESANLESANLINAKKLTPEQVKKAQNWKYAKYDEELRKQLGLPPESSE